VATVKVYMTGDEHLNTISDGIASCKGDRHDFPKMRVGPLPKGVTSRPVRQGVYQLTYTCPDCGTQRTRTTLRGGILSGAKYRYKYDDEYLAPKGAGLTKADYVAELGRRQAPYVRDAARKNGANA
jgi:hypothetical protein